MILSKWQYSKIWSFLIADIYHFYLSLIHLFKKMKHWNLDIIGFLEIPENYCAWLYWSTGQVWWLNELLCKRYIWTCTTNTHDVIDLVDHRMFKNIKNQFLDNGIWLFCDIYDLCLRWHIVRIYRLLAEVTFNRQPSSLGSF